ncbi:unnamed protein product, partial [Mesorhabditis belari]|uniref:Uncharacterized protein n=1 Tax=Mesorhabditis belari TaxID=2138241 RepID=A0AAF3J6R7_9BILA
MEGEIRTLDDLKGKMSNLTAIHLQLRLRDTACIELKSPNSSQHSYLHTIEFKALEQHYPVLNTYKFAIPRVSPSCKCDCPNGMNVCTPEKYHYKACSSGSFCQRTYHADQSSLGCVSSGNSAVCCAIRIDPFKEMKFTAVQIEQADTILVLHYRIFERRTGGRWRLAEDGEANKIIPISMNKGGESIELSRHLVDISVSGGRPAREILPGVYFVREGTHELRGGIQLNRPEETSLNKMGWFRKNTNEQWEVRRGEILLKSALHVKVNDCIKQNYSWTWNAEQYVDVVGTKETEFFDLGKPLTDYAWIREALFRDRVVKVDHKEGTTVSLYISTTSRPSIISHPSQFASFDGVFRLDQNSNRFLNLTFQDAKGTMIGKIYRDADEKETDMTFSVQTADSRVLRSPYFLIAVPAIDSRRFVCFHPSSDQGGKQCKWLEFNATEPAQVQIAHPWQTAQGDCVGCNERGFDALWVAIDPRRWLDGINTTTELVTMLIEVAIAVLGMLMVVMLFSKIIYPMCRCVIFMATPPTPKK